MPKLKKESKISTLFKSVDSYGQTATIEHSHKSLIGAFCTVLTMTGVLSYGLYLLISELYKPIKWEVLTYERSVASQGQNYFLPFDHVTMGLTMMEWSEDFDQVGIEVKPEDATYEFYYEEEGMYWPNQACYNKSDENPSRM
jgi:hypothetical protein